MLRVGAPAWSRLSWSALLLALLAGPALAQSEGTLDPYQRGLQLHDQGRFQEALRVLEQALETTSDPHRLGLIHLQLGLDHAILGHRERARAAFRSALLSDPALQIDAEAVKPSIVKLFESERERLRLRLRPSTGRRATTLPGAASPTARAAAGSSSAAPAPASAPAAVSLPSPRPRRIWTWVAAAAALASAGTGVGLWAHGRAGYQEYLTTEDPLRFDELQASVPHRYLAADVMLGVAASLAAASLVLYFVEGRRRQEGGRGQASRPGQLQARASGNGLELRF